MASSELVKVDLLQSHFNKKATEQITKWWNGQISGERCAKAVVDAAGDALPVAGAVVGYTAGMAAGAAGGPVGIVVGGLSGAAVGGLAGQAVNRVIQVLRYTKLITLFLKTHGIQFVSCRS